MSSGFRCIIVGGGPVGLITAHALSAAGLDWVLLDKHETIISSDGPFLKLYPHTIRVMDQLGLLHRLSSIKSTMRHTKSLTHDGVWYTTAYPYNWSMENHGRGNWFLHRPEFLKTLYDAFSEQDKPRVKMGKEVKRIDNTTHGVITHCSDGTTESGSIIIGADGTHSTVRSIMTSRTSQESGDKTTNNENSFLATYRALWGTLPMIEGMEPNEAWECHGLGSSSQIFLGRGRGWFVLYEKLEIPTREYRVYTQQDMDDYARKLANLPMTDELSARDVYAASHSCGMTDLREGLLETWSWNRTVLIGDAVHTQTLTYGLGFNSGVQDVVALINALRRAVMQRVGKEVDTETIQKAFEDYETARRTDALYSLDISARETRFHTWDTRSSWILDRYIIPATRSARKIYARVTGRICSRGLILDFVEENDPQDGQIPWVNR